MLQDDIWLGRIGECTGLQLVSVTQLWAGFTSLLEMNLSNGRAIDLDKFGVLSLGLHKEYLARTLEGKVYLVPPRLSLRLRSKAVGENGVVCFEDLAEPLGEVTKLPLSAVQPFLRALIPLSEESFSRGNPVVWPGIGIWTMDASEQSPIYRLTVSHSFGDLLNKPFGGFSPIPASDELISRANLQIIEISSIDDLGGDLHLEHQFIELSEEDVLAPIGTPEVTNSEQENVSIGGEAKVVPLDDLSEDTSGSLKDGALEESVQEGGEEEAKALFVEAEDRRQKHRIYWVMLLALLIFCLCLLWFLGKGTMTENVPRKLVPQTEEPRTKEIAKVDSVAFLPIGTERGKREEVKTISSNQASVSLKTQDLPSNEGEDHRPKKVMRTENSADRLEIVVLGEGESLQTLARRKYGDPVFWVYIYEENREFISDPDEIPSGIQLRLPPAKQYRINANDTKSRQRALVLQRSYQTYR